LNGDIQDVVKEIDHAEVIPDAARATAAMVKPVGATRPVPRSAAVAKGLSVAIHPDQRADSIAGVPETFGAKHALTVVGTLSIGADQLIQTT
jgi:hypothetical protein